MNQNTSEAVGRIGFKDVASASSRGRTDGQKNVYYINGGVQFAQYHNYEASYSFITHFIASSLTPTLGLGSENRGMHNLHEM